MVGGEGCSVGRRSGEIIPATASLALSTYSTDPTYQNTYSHRHRLRKSSKWEVYSACRSHFAMKGVRSTMMHFAEQLCVHPPIFYIAQAPLCDIQSSDIQCI